MISPTGNTFWQIPRPHGIPKLESINFRTEVCLKAKDSRLAMRWIKEIGIAKSIDDLITTRSIVGRTDFPDYDELDAMMASASRKHHDRQTHFRKKVSVEEQRAQNNDRSLRERQIAFMIYDRYRSIGSCDGIHGLSGLFSIGLNNDDIQDFDLRWSDPRADNIVEGLCKSKLQDPSQLQTMMAQYNQETIRSGGEPDCNRLRKCVKLHIDIDQTLSNKNFKIQNEMVERGVTSKTHKEEKSFVERKAGECFQWKANGSCSKGGSCSFRHNTASVNRCKSASDGNASSSHRPTASGNRCGDGRSKEQLSSLAPKSKAKSDVQTSNSRRESPAKRMRIPCRFGSRCKKTSCNFWHPVVCHHYKTESGCKYGTNCQFRQSDAEEAPSTKSQKEIAKGRKKSTLVVYLKIPIQRSRFNGKLETWDRTRQRDTT